MSASAGPSVAESRPERRSDQRAPSVARFVRATIPMTSGHLASVLPLSAARYGARVSGEHQCELCGAVLSTANAAYLHRQNVHVRNGVVSSAPLTPSTNESATAKGRQRFSRASADGACPRCHGTDFTAKRSKKGKAIGALFGGIGLAAAPKSQVKCVSCGLMFKRG